MRSGVLEELFPGVYRYPAAPVTWEQKVHSAQAWAGPGSATSPERTLLDLGRSVSTRMLESALDDAICRRLTTTDRVWSFLDKRGRSGRDGTAALRAALVQLYEGPGADHFERLLFAALTKASLPRPVAQQRVVAGGRTFYLDFAYPVARLGIEAHSYKFHSQRGHWEKDQVRHSLLTGEGWTILYVTWRRLRDHPTNVTGEIERALDHFAQLNDNKLAL